MVHFGDQQIENSLLFEIDQLGKSSSDAAFQLVIKAMFNVCICHNFLDLHNCEANNKNVKKRLMTPSSTKYFLLV